MTHRPVPRLAGAVLAALIAGAACSNPVTPENHTRPNGVQILLGGEPLAGEAGGVVTGELMMVPGQEIGPVTVQFMAGSAAVTPGTDYFLEVAVANGAIAQFTPTAPGAFTGTFRGNAPGATTVQLRWMHGRVGSARAHQDFQSAPIPIVVAPVSGS